MLRSWCFFSLSRNSPHFANPTFHYPAHNSPSVDHSARPIQSISSLHSISWKSVFIISSYLCPVLPNGFFTHVSPNNPVCPLFLSTFQMPPHIPPFSFNYPVTFSQQYWSWISPLCNLLRSTVSQFLSATNIFLSSLFSNTHSLCSSLSIRQHVLHPYINRQSFISVYINFYFW